MKKYNVKIGNLYVHDIDLKDSEVNTNFINNIELRAIVQPYSLKVNEEYCDKMRDILKEVLGLVNEFDEIEFVEVQGEDNFNANNNRNTKTDNTPNIKNR